MATLNKTQEPKKSKQSSKQPQQQNESFQIEQEPLPVLLQRAETAPDSITPADTDRLQRAVGNQTVGQSRGSVVPPETSTIRDSSLQAIIARTTLLQRQIDEDDVVMKPAQGGAVQQKHHTPEKELGDSTNQLVNNDHVQRQIDLENKKAPTVDIGYIGIENKTDMFNHYIPLGETVDVFVTINGTMMVNTTDSISLAIRGDGRAGSASVSPEKIQTSGDVKVKGESVPYNPNLDKPEKILHRISTN